MAMDRESFNSLCVGVAAALGGQDPAELSGGKMFFVDGIECHLAYLPERGSAQASFELGDPKPGTELELYRQLFDIQSMLAGYMDGMFIRDPLNESVLFTIRIALVDEQNAESFTGLLRTLAAQAQRWRDTVMAGHFIDYEALAEQMMNEDAGLSTVEV
jgi:hypothetical protein